MLSNKMKIGNGLLQVSHAYIRISLTAVYQNFFLKIINFKEESLIKKI
jgi:hypothetical protein